MSSDMLVTVLKEPPVGKLVAEDYGIVTGTAVMSRAEIIDAMARLKSWFGGHVRSYEKMVKQGLGAAYDEIRKKARGLNPNVNAVLGIQVSFDQIGGDMVGVIFIGSAVRLEDID